MYVCVQVEGKEIQTPPRTDIQKLNNAFTVICQPLQVVYFIAKGEEVLIKDCGVFMMQPELLQTDYGCLPIAVALFSSYNRSSQKVGPKKLNGPSCK